MHQIECHLCSFLHKWRIIPHARAYVLLQQSFSRLTEQKNFTTALNMHLANYTCYYSSIHQEQLPRPCSLSERHSSCFQMLAKTFSNGTSAVSAALGRSTANALYKFSLWYWQWRKNAPEAQCSHTLSFWMMRWRRSAARFRRARLYGQPRRCGKTTDVSTTEPWMSCNGETCKIVKQTKSRKLNEIKARRWSVTAAYINLVCLHTHQSTKEWIKKHVNESIINEQINKQRKK